MRYAFFGTPEFAAIILEKLIEAGFPPALVICNPDRPLGRKKIITPPPVKQVAKEYVASSKEGNIKIIQPEKLSDAYSLLHATNYQFGIVAAYAKIIPQPMIDAFPRGIIGVHPSLLPKHRGASPIQSSILAGDKETGVTLFMIDKEVDHGPILVQQELEFSIFPSTSSGSRVESRDNFQFPKLQEELAKLGAELLIKTLPKFVAGTIIPQEQDHTQATFTKKFATEDGFVQPEGLLTAQSEGGNAAIEIDRKIRALNPEPGVWSYAEGIVAKGFMASARKRVKILEASLTPNNKLVIKKIQIEGKSQSTLMNQEPRPKGDEV